MLVELTARPRTRKRTGGRTVNATTTWLRSAGSVSALAGSMYAPGVRDRGDDRDRADEPRLAGITDDVLTGMRGWASASAADDAPEDETEDQDRYEPAE